MVPVIITTLVIVSVCVGAVALMWFGWRQRQRKQADLLEPPHLPDGLGEPDYAIDDVHYVATSITGEALERVVVPPLGYRGRATIEVHPQGIAVGIAATRPFFIPPERIETIARAQATIDRAVERDGLLVIRWMLTNTQSVETYFRVVNPTERRQLTDAFENLTTQTHQQEHA